MVTVAVVPVTFITPELISIVVEFPVTLNLLPDAFDVIVLTPPFTLTVPVTGPTVVMFRKTGAAALGAGKFALKHGALGFPGLIATVAYYGAKALGKKYGRKYHFSPVRQFDKKGRKIL